MGRSLGRRSHTELGVPECGFETPRWRHLDPRGSSNHVLKKNNYKYMMYGIDLKHRSPTRDPGCSMRPVAAFAHYVCTTEVTQNPDGRYTTYCYLFTCDPRPSPQYRVWPFAIKRMETVAERLNRGDNARVLVPPRSRHTWVGWLDSSQPKT